MLVRLIVTALFVLAAVIVLADDRQTEAVFPGTNGRIAFTNFTNNDTEIWTMNPDGSDRTQITDHPTATSTQPAFSPDGETILFLRNTGEEDTRGLYTVSAGGGTPQLIPNATDDALDGAWSPDGERIVFSRLLGPADVFTINLDGTGETNLTPNTTNAEDRHPDWSPLGDKIAWSNSDIWVMDTDGGNKTNLTNTPGIAEDNPDWSPDGQRIIFDTSLPPARQPAGFIGNRNVAVINADGTGEIEMLTNNPEIDQFDPVFSPDGQQIAYTQQPTDGIGTAAFGITGTIVADADGSDAHDVSGEAPDDSSPDWGVDEPATPAPTTSPTPTAGPGEQLVWGDHNCSGAADPIDSLLTLRFDAGLSTNTGDCPDLGETVDVAAASEHSWGDVDCTGDVGPIDSLKLLRYDAGLSVSQQPDCPLIGSGIQLFE